MDSYSEYVEKMLAKFFWNRAIGFFFRVSSITLGGDFLIRYFSPEDLDEGQMKVEIKTVVRWEQEGVLDKVTDEAQIAELMLLGL